MRPSQSPNRRRLTGVVIRVMSTITVGTSATRRLHPETRKGSIRLREPSCWIRLLEQPTISCRILTGRREKSMELRPISTSNHRKLRSPSTRSSGRRSTTSKKCGRRCSRRPGTRCLQHLSRSYVLWSISRSKMSNTARSRSPIPKLRSNLTAPGLNYPSRLPRRKSRRGHSLHGRRPSKKRRGKRQRLSRRLRARKAEGETRSPGYHLIDIER